MCTTKTQNENNEILVRKRVARFIENLFSAHGYVINHDRFKQVIYGEEAYNGAAEEKFKKYYDAYLFLLNNRKNPLTRIMIANFLMLLCDGCIEDNAATRLVKYFFERQDNPAFETAVDFHTKVYDELADLREIDRTAASLMFMNFALARNNISPLSLTVDEYEIYRDLREKLRNGDKTGITVFVMKLIHSNKVQDRAYYENLRPLCPSEIISAMLEDKVFLENELKIKSLSIFGSFAKENYRIDSDIDLLVSFSKDLETTEKASIIKFLKKHYFIKFNRFIDITEISDYLSDDFIKNTSHIKTIFNGGNVYE